MNLKIPGKYLLSTRTTALAIPMPMRAVATAPAFWLIASPTAFITLINALVNAFITSDHVGAADMFYTSN